MAIGPIELLVIAAILFVVVGLPLAIIVLVILLIKRNSGSQPRDQETRD